MTPPQCPVAHSPEKRMGEPRTSEIFGSIAGCHRSRLKSEQPSQFHRYQNTTAAHRITTSPPVLRRDRRIPTRMLPLVPSPVHLGALVLSHSKASRAPGPQVLLKPRGQLRHRQPLLRPDRWLARGSITVSQQEKFFLYWVGLPGDAVAFALPFAVAYPISLAISI